MIEIELNNVKKNFGLKNVLDGVTFVAQTGERISLIGENGSGKSTIFKIISGIEKQDEGTVNIRKGASIGYLKQVYGNEQAGVLVEDYLKESFKEYAVIENKLRELELKMASEDQELELVLQKYGRLQERYKDLFYRKSIFVAQDCQSCNALRVSAHKHADRSANVIISYRFMGVNEGLLIVILFIRLLDMS